jgi:hypothetical protein
LALRADTTSALGASQAITEIASERRATPANRRRYDGGGGEEARAAVGWKDFDGRRKSSRGELDDLGWYAGRKSWRRTAAEENSARLALRLAWNFQTDHQTGPVQRATKIEPEQRVRRFFRPPREFPKTREVTLCTPRATL